MWLMKYRVTRLLSASHSLLALVSRCSGQSIDRADFWLHLTVALPPHAPDGGSCCECLNDGCPRANKRTKPLGRVLSVEEFVDRLRRNLNRVVRQDGSVDGWERQ